MHYEDLQKIQHKDSVEGASLLLGEISAVGPEVLTLRSALGTHYGLTMVPHEFVSACRPGQFAIVFDLGEKWSLYDAYDDYEMASAGLREGLTIAAKTVSERRALQDLRAAKEAADAAGKADDATDTPTSDAVDVPADGAGEPAPPPAPPADATTDTKAPEGPVDGEDGDGDDEQL